MMFKLTHFDSQDSPDDLILVDAGAVSLVESVTSLG